MPTPTLESRRIVRHHNAGLGRIPASKRLVNNWASPTTLSRHSQDATHDPAAHDSVWGQHLIRASSHKPVGDTGWTRFGQFLSRLDAKDAADVESPDPVHGSRK